MGKRSVPRGPSVRVEGLRKRFRIGTRKSKTLLGRVVHTFSGRVPRRDLEVLKGLSFSVGRGEVVGVIGVNGSGKSTLLRVLAGILPRYSGVVSTSGRIIPLINLGMGFRPRLSMRDNVFLVGALFGMRRSDIRRKFSAIVRFAGLKGFTETKLFQFSRGMKERLAFSIAVHAEPDVLLLDEVFAVGDEDFRERSAERILELSRRGCAVVFVSHELWMVKRYCSRVLWLEKGRVKVDGTPSEVLPRYRKVSWFEGS